MTSRLPPIPGGDLNAWALAMYDYLSAQSGVKGQIEPTPVSLPHMVSNVMARAATDGILLYDPVLKAVVVSKNGAFEPVGNVTTGDGDFILDEGDSLGAGFSLVFDDNGATG